MIGKRLALALAASAAALALGVALLARGGERAVPQADISLPVARPPPVHAPEETAAGGPARAVERVEPPPAAPAEPAAPARSFAARGVAVDAGGAPLQGIGLATAADGAGAEPRGRTAGDGSFALELERAIAEIVPTDAAWLVIDGGTFRAETEAPLHLVLAPRGSFTGFVVDARTDEPLAGARVRAVPPSGIAWSAAQQGGALSDEDGAFLLENVPALAGVRLSATAAGYLETALEPDPEANAAGVLRLEPADPPRARGRVLRSDGGPAGGAELALGAARAVAGRDGRFELPVPRGEPGAELVARLAPDAPAGLPGAGDRLLAGADLNGLELVLSNLGGAIEGRVLDAAGQPQKGFAVEARAPGDALPAGRQARTRKDGRFRIEGLRAGVYDVTASGRSHAELAFAGAVEAPSAGVELALTARLRRVSGTVLDAGGAPVERDVLLLSPAEEETLAEARSDSAGRFLFAEAPEHALRVRALPLPGEPGLPGTAPVAAGPDAAVELKLEAGTALRFESAVASAPPESLSAVDAAGAAVPVWDAGGRLRARIDLCAGRSEPFRAPAAAVELVLVRGGREVQRVAATPDADGLVRR